MTEKLNYGKDLLPEGITIKQIQVKNTGKNIFFFLLDDNNKVYILDIETIRDKLVITQVDLFDATPEYLKEIFGIGNE